MNDFSRNLSCVSNRLHNQEVEASSAAVRLQCSPILRAYGAAGAGFCYPEGVIAEKTCTHVAEPT
ncbi:MAG TPA: hypothetical protein P5211_10435, partial [Anaerolineae bacterium]|nr:hypothetical protein [Anaerolineae bacterium]